MIKSINYRADIDGLRALAVVGVIFYHAEIFIFDKTFFSGGYLGVDIFFTISGFLITSILIKNQKKEFLSLLIKFYISRVRRLFPALIFLIFSLSIFASFFFDEYVLHQFAQAIISSLFFFSNYFFWLSGESYAAFSSQYNPLLHTWSLSVEEQFYILFPIFFLVALKLLKKNIFFIIFLLLLISLFGSQYFGQSYVSFNFYSIASRFWQIISGSCCAIALYQFPNQNFFKNKQFFSNIGLILILFSFFYYDKENINPSLFTSIPIVGTALIILFNNQFSLSFTILSHKFSIFIGLMSYSLYLWHYPIFSITKIMNQNEISFFLKFCLLFLSFFISFLSYKFIEIPCRKKNQIKNKIFFYIILVSYLALITSAIIFLNFGNFKKKQSFLNIEQNNEKLRLVWWDRIIKNKYIKFPKNNKTKILIIGNSHARDLYNSFDLNKDLFRNYEFSVFDTQMSCFKKNIDLVYDNNCKFLYEDIDKFKYVENFKENLKSADFVMLSTEWSYADVLSIEDEILPYLKTNGKKIIITSNTPKFFFNMKKNHYTLLDIQLNNLLPNQKLDTNIIREVNRTHFKSRSSEIKKLNNWLKSIALRNSVIFLNKDDFICDNNLAECSSITPNGFKIFWDNSHYTIEGAKYFGELIFKKKWLNLETYYTR